MSSTRCPNTSRGWFFKDIPAEWESLPLKYACDLTSEYGANLPADRYASEGIRFLRTSDINDNGELATGGVFISEADAAEYLLAERDLLISRSGTLGRSFLYSTSHGPCAYAGYLIRYRLRQSFHPRYIFCVTKSAGFQEWIGTVAIEATIGNVNGEKYANFSFPAPGFETQLLIANYLDLETARIDRLIAEKERMLALLNEKRSALISRVVTRGLDANAPLKPSGLEWLGESPAHWEIQPIKYLAEVGNGSTPSIESTDYWDEGGFPWLNSSVVNVSPVTSASRYVTEIALRECHLPKIHPPAVLVGITGQGKTRGMAALLGMEATINQHLAFIKPRSQQIGTEYLYYLLGHAYSFLRSDSDAAGSTKGAITCEQLASMKIPVPPINEQIDICTTIGKSLEVSRPLLSEIMRSLHLLAERRTSLITAAVTGQIPLEGLK
jgi:type I restriction enzyme S subunit